MTQGRMKKGEEGKRSSKGLRTNRSYVQSIRDQNDIQYTSTGVPRKRFPCSITRQRQKGLSQRETTICLCTRRVGVDHTDTSTRSGGVMYGVRS